MKEKQLKTVLIAPPHFYLFNTLGTPQLTAYLRSKGHKVENILVDTDMYTFLLTPPELTQCFQKIETELLPRMKTERALYQEVNERLSEHEGIKDILSFLGILRGDEGPLTVIEKVLRFKKSIIRMCPIAVTQIEGNYVRLGYDDFIKKLGAMNLGMQVASLAHFPTRIDLIEGVEMRYSGLSIKDIVKAIGDRKENFLIDYYEKRLYPRLAQSGAGVVGIQINHENQMIPAFTIMSWVRQNLPDAFIIIGGTLVSYLRQQITQEPELWNFFDGIGTGMGEYTLDSLIECLEHDLPLSEVPNLTYRNNQGKVQVTRSVQVDMDDVVMPEYLETRPSPILPYLSAAGCYWGKCAFCEYVYHHMCAEKVDGKSSYYVRSLRKVVDDLITLKEKYDPFFFFFCDSDIPPARLEQLADMILEEGLDIKFFVWIRAEKEFLSYELCEKLAKAGVFGAYMGLEAGCQRINDFMDKGIAVADVEQIIRNFHRAGIICSVFSMVGSPTETRDEAMRTLEFFRRNQKFIDGTISISTFMLSAYSGISANPTKYGVSIKKPIEGTLAAVFDYDIAVGLTQAESVKLRDEFREELGVKYLGKKFLMEFLHRSYPKPVLLVKH